MPLLHNKSIEPIRTRVTHSGDVLDHHDMVRVFTLLVHLARLARELGRSLKENRVGSDHVVHDGRLGDFLGAELGLGREAIL